MSDEEEPPARIRAAHRALVLERIEALSRRPGPRSSREECVVIGHAWISDEERDEHGLICLICGVVRRR